VWPEPGHELELSMDSLHFLLGREPELRGLIESSRPPHPARTACRGADVDAYHPTDGQRPAAAVLARCVGCAARLECLALALRAEDPKARQGWYGGIGPGDRDRLAAVLRLPSEATPLPDRAVTAIRLGRDGWRVNDIARALGCSRRTVQRYLHAAP
jgi:DNA-binding NarL/FixJ family response regulator